MGFNNLTITMTDSRTKYHKRFFKHHEKIENLPADVTKTCEEAESIIGKLALQKPITERVETIQGLIRRLEDIQTKFPIFPFFSHALKSYLDAINKMERLITSVKDTIPLRPIAVTIVHYICGDFGSLINPLAGPAVQHSDIATSYKP